MLIIRTRRGSPIMQVTEKAGDYALGLAYQKGRDSLWTPQPSRRSHRAEKAALDRPTRLGRPSPSLRSSLTFARAGAAQPDFANASESQILRKGRRNHKRTSTSPAITTATPITMAVPREPARPDGSAGALPAEHKARSQLGAIRAGRANTA